ncbi:AraC family transcriptional regulator [Paenibacillus agricola]|uniref:AraC family transcriptional regulator n=1 Tax=Paenibacillus agricola TaxID=2716264 RepID=A0ABX0J9T6_9BACL|nr:AraC family transcriptional regulator [Paenibacillus agricola]NHN32708.1 AraC family transcriptional regulator [Paenibacillus agricola]
MKWIESAYIFLIDMNTRPGYYFHRMIWLGCISVCIPVILAGFVYYNFVINKEKAVIREDNQTSLLLIRDRVESLLQSLEEQSLQLAIDPIISASFALPDFRDNVDYQLDLLKAITIKKYSNKMIGDIVFYNDMTGQLFSSNDGQIRNGKIKFHADLDKVMNSDQLSQWLPLNRGKSQDLLSYARKLPVISGGKPSGLIIIYVKMEVLRTYSEDYSGIGISNSKLITVLDNDNKSILYSNKSSPINQPLLSTMISILESADLTSDNFIAVDENGKSMIFSHFKTAFGRTYLSMIPEKVVTDRLNWIRTYTIIQVILFILIGIISTLIVSKKNYSPIKQLIHFGRDISEGRIAKKGNDISFIRECMVYLQNETKLLENYRSKTKNTLCERFLQKVIMGNLHGFTEPDIKNECESYGISFNQNYVVLIANIENLYKERRFLPEDKPIISYAVINIMEELLLQNKTKITGFVFQSIDGNNVALLQFSRGLSEEETIELASNYALSTSESISRYLKLEMSVGIGKIYAHISDVSLSYREAQLALQYRIYKDAERVLYIGFLEHAKKQSMFFYPHSTEERIIKSLKAGDLKAAEVALNEFADVTRSSESYNLIYQSYHVLLSAVIMSFEKQGGSTLEMMEYNLFDQLRNRHTSCEILDWFHEDLFPLYLKLIGTNNFVTRNASLKQVCTYIMDHIDSEISLVQCADLIHMSPSYLSRIFKKEVGTSFMEFVMVCKVNKVKSLLLDTDQKISDIALLVGYSERNLNRIFQKYTQLSPSQFRLFHR